MTVEYSTHAVSSATYRAFKCGNCDEMVSAVEECPTCGCSVCERCMCVKGSTIQEGDASGNSHIPVGIRECFACWIERRGGAKPDRHQKEG